MTYALSIIAYSCSWQCQATKWNRQQIIWEAQSVCLQVHCLTAQPDNHSKWPLMSGTSLPTLQSSRFRSWKISSSRMSCKTFLVLKKQLLNAGAEKFESRCGGNDVLTDPFPFPDPDDRVHDIAQQCKSLPPIPLLNMLNPAMWLLKWWRASVNIDYLFLSSLGHNSLLIVDPWTLVYLTRYLLLSHSLFFPNAVSPGWYLLLIGS